MSTEKDNRSGKSSANKTEEKREPKIGVGELIGAISFMTDIAPSGNTYHTWRVALIAQHLASILAPDIRNDVFYAGLLQDIGTVGAYKHITAYESVKEQICDAQIRTHTDRGSAMVELLPGMSTVAEIIKLHHEWWNGQGYPYGISGSDIPIGSQILRIADAAVMNKCFSGSYDFVNRLRSIAPLTGLEWSTQLWETLIHSISDAEFYRALMDTSELPGLISKVIRDTQAPRKLCSEEGIERVFHIFSTLTDARDPLKSGHALRTAQYARAIARQMNMSEENVHMTYRAGLVHDCGRLAVPLNILRRSGRLTQEEMEQMRQHAIATTRILSSVPYRYALIKLAKIAGNHHEWVDGSGYPHHLTIKNLHPITRILSVADAFDSMMSVASYRSLSSKCAIMRLRKAAGTQFDPAVVEALTTMIENGTLSSELQAA